MDVKVFGPNLDDQSKGDMHVHAADCGDCKHYGPGKRFGGEREGWQLSVDTVEEVTEAVYGPDEFEYDPATEIDQYTASFYYAPCTADLPNREAADDDEDDPTIAQPTTFGIDEQGNVSEGFVIKGQAR